MKLEDIEALHASGCARRAGLCGAISPPDPMVGGSYVCTRGAGHADFWDHSDTTLIDQHEARSVTGQLFASWRPLVWTVALGDH